MDAEGRLLTVEEFERLPDEECRMELVEGRVVREPPAGFGHGQLAARLAWLLERHLRETGAGGIVVGAETGFTLSEQSGTVRAPDVAYVSPQRVPPPEARTGFARVAPDLAIEVVSPSNTAAEIQAKVMDYLGAGSRAVWIVDPRTRSVTAYRSLRDIRLLCGSDSIDGGDVLPGFTVTLEELFGES